LNKLDDKDKSLAIEKAVSICLILNFELEFERGLSFVCDAVLLFRVHQFAVGKLEIEVEVEQGDRESDG
jgi:hypothetical protein